MVLKAKKTIAMDTNWLPKPLNTVSTALWV